MDTSTIENALEIMKHEFAIYDVFSNLLREGKITEDDFNQYVGIIPRNTMPILVFEDNLPKLTNDLIDICSDILEKNIADQMVNLLVDQN